MLQPHYVPVPDRIVRSAICHCTPQLHELILLPGWFVGWLVDDDDGWFGWWLLLLAGCRIVGPGWLDDSETYLTHSLGLGWDFKQQCGRATVRDYSNWPKRDLMDLFVTLANTRGFQWIFTQLFSCELMASFAS